MKICILSNGYPDRRDPQAGNFEKDQAIALKRNGHDVSIIYVDSRMRWWWRSIGMKHFVVDGINVYGTFVFPFNVLVLFPFFSEGIYWIKSRLMQRMLSRMMREQGKPDVIYAHFMGNIALGAYLKKENGIPLVGIEHWSVLMREKLNKSQLSAGHKGYENCNRLLAVSEKLRESIKRHFGINSVVVPNMLGEEFINRPSFNTINRLKDIFPSGLQNDGNFVFLSVGSLKHIKGYDIMLNAFAKSHLAERGCRLVMIGGGEEHNNLEKQIHDLNLADYVKMVGRKGKKDIIEIMSECHVFVLSSRSETFSVACIEAMSQGLPCIATTCGGPQEIVTEQSGILVPPEDSDAMAEAMVQMYAKYSDYNKTLIMEDCVRRYSPQIIAAKLTKIFEETINN